MIPRGIFSMPNTSTVSYRPLATCAAPSARAAPPLAQPADHLETVGELDDAEAVGDVAAIARRPRQDHGEELQSSLRPGGRVAHLRRSAVGADCSGREVQLAADRAARGEKAGPVGP